MDQKVIADVEKNIQHYFSPRWTKENIEFFLGSSKYEIDVYALQNSLNKPIRSFLLRGGKRLRPLLFWTILKAYKKEKPNLLSVASLIELVHNGTLVLDDIEDNALTRRGKPSSHREFGLDTATNVGMSLHVLPLMLLLKEQNGLTNDQKIRLFEVYAEELTNVSFGQALDIYWHKNARHDITRKKYFEMVRLKTGSLMRMSAKMAAIMADQDKRTEDAFASFAESIGVAFQIIDDTLDLEKADVRFGKAYGNDISEGKISLPVIEALHSLDEKDTETLLQILDRHTHDKRVIKKAIGLIIKGKGTDRAKKRARDLVSNALSDLTTKLGDTFESSEIVALAQFMLDRTY